MIPRCFPQNSSGYMKVLPVSATGKRRWVDYVPVKDMGGSATSSNTHVESGGVYKAEVITSTSGLKEWIDYIPVVFVDDSAASVVMSLPLTQDIVDDSGHTWTAQGGAAVTDGALVLDGTGDHITSPDSTDWDFGTGDFTVECNVKHGAIVTPGCRYVSKWTDPSSRSWRFGYIFSTSSLGFVYSADGTAATTKSQPWTPTLDQWYHIAVVRLSGSLRFYVDGVPLAANTAVATDFFASDAIGRIGAGDTGQEVTGALRNVRVTKGVGRYNGTFTPAPMTGVITSSSASFDEANDDGYIPIWTP